MIKDTFPNSRHDTSALRTEVSLLHGFLRSHSRGGVACLWRSWFVYTGREQINYATNRRSGVLPFSFWTLGKKYEKKTPDYRLIRDRQAKRKT